MPLESFSSHDSQEGENVHVLTCVLTKGVKHWSILYGYQKGIYLVLGIVFSTYRSVFSRSGRRVREREEILHDQASKFRCLIYQEWKSGVFLTWLPYKYWVSTWVYSAGFHMPICMSSPWFSRKAKRMDIHVLEFGLLQTANCFSTIYPAVVNLLCF